jgi:hypothetical protein
MLVCTGKVEGVTPQGVASRDAYDLNRPALVKRRKKSQDIAIDSLWARVNNPPELARKWV